MKYNILLCALIMSLAVSAAEISGFVYSTKNGVKEPLIGANVFTQDKKYGTSTDLDGKFKLLLPNKTPYTYIKVSSISYEPKTVNILDKKYIEVELKASTLDDVVIERKKSTRLISSPYDIQIIDEAELEKAACCNLSESFETNAAVDVQFADAVTGTKKLKMLGLDGYYTQTVFENNVGIRGLENGLGVLFVPGPFMSSVAINKGAGSVVNGYDAITGQINYEYKKPENSERFFLNLFASRHGLFELNTNFSHRFNKKWSTLTMIHGSIHESIHDENQDSFQDVPLNERINFLNRWKYFGKKFRSQFGINYVYDERTSGQLKQLALNENKTQLYDTEIISRKISAFAKTGFILPNNNQSIGIQYNYNNFSQNAWVGNRIYKGQENFARINFIFQSDIPNNKFSTMKLGASYVLDDFKESLDTLVLDRMESVPGIFAEYNYQDNEKFAAVIGVRADYNNLHGFWISPKVNFKYTFLPDFTLKLAAGKGYRTANVVSENMSALVSSRSFEVQKNLGYESAWNAGIGLTKKFLVGFQELVLSADYYHTNFTNQVVVDYEDVNRTQIYNLDGTSIANSFQFEAQYEAFEGFDIKIAYKLDDIYMTYKSGMKAVPYIPKHKLLATLDYETVNEKWKFNLTGQLKGPARLPSTASNEQIFQRADFSKTFFLLNAQITYTLKRFDFYIGGENLTNYKQKQAIIDAENAFGSNFDASMIWGPIAGVRLYGGLRYTIPYPKTENKFVIKKNIKQHKNKKDEKHEEHNEHDGHNH